MAVCVIWTSVTNDNTCIKYLESVLWATFIGTSYSTLHGTITVFEYDTIRTGILAHAFWMRVSFPEVQSFVEAGCTDVQIAWPLECTVRVYKCLAQAHSNDNTGRCMESTIRSVIIAWRCAVEAAYIFAPADNYRTVSCLGEHSMQGTSTPWVNKEGTERICL